MNDFTKEELQIILLDMKSYVNRTPMLDESPSHKSLRDKVESMIDNYCYEYVTPIITNEMLTDLFHGKSIQLLPSPGADYYYELHPEGEIIKKKVSDE